MNIQKETITPKKAMEWLKRNVSNRPLSQVHAGRLGAAMAAGVFKCNGDCIRFNGNGDLVDGQHRLTGCVQSGKSFESYVVRGLEHDAFDTIDQGRKRTVGDVFARQGYKHYVCLASAVRWLWLYETCGSLLGGRNGSLRADEANELLEKHPAIHAAVDQALKIRANGKLIHPGILSFLLYYTSQKDEEKAVKFWTSVISGENLKRGTSEFLLHKRLVDNLGSVSKISVETIGALAIKAWNSHKAGKPCGTLKWSINEEFPKISI